MLEKFKTSFLVFLICLSILLTYRLWFGRPPIEEGILPRYELAYFTETPSLSRIILPSKIIFEHEGLKYIFQRGEQNTEQLWEETLQIMMLPGKIMTQIEKEEVLDFFTKSSFKAIYQFSPLLPPEFISERLSFISSAIQEVIFLWDEKLLRIIVCAEKHYFWELPGLKGQVLQEKLLSLPGQTCLPLPTVFNLLKSENSNGEQQILLMSKENVPEGVLETGNVKGIEVNSNYNELESWEVHVDRKIYLPEQEILASELLLSQEKINRDKLIRAFFYDLSMARCIEEQDGALYYTDGEKGLRIYPQELVEYSAPGLESSAGKISYLASLQKGAEKQSLYGGWPPGAYLVEAEKTGKGYQLLWYTFHEGLPIKGKEIGSKMIVNERGVPFYLRCFRSPGEKVEELKPFRPFKEAIYQALKHQQEFLKGKKVTLLTLEPVYYFDESITSNKAIPAWAVQFAGTETVYLHWSTLEILNCLVTGGES